MHITSWKHKKLLLKLLKALGIESAADKVFTYSVLRSAGLSHEDLLHSAPHLFKT